MSEATKAIRPPGAPPGASQRPRAPRASAVLILGYAAAVYGLFVAVLVYAVGFFAGFAVPKDIDDGLRSGWPLAVAIDLGLLALFAVQHTVMARPWFKRRSRRPAGHGVSAISGGLSKSELFALQINNRPAG